nr:protein PHOSPHATE STARVATION RESPONSE 1-like [Nicotiana tomentosiformis]
MLLRITVHVAAQKIPAAYLYVRIDPKGAIYKPHISSRAIPSASNSGTIGHLLSSTSRPHKDIHFSPTSSQESRPRSYPFISSEVSATTCQSSLSSLCSASLDNYPMRNKNNSWSKDAYHDLTDFPTNVPVQNGQVEKLPVVMASDDQTKRPDWQEWADQLINDDDALCSSWIDHLVNVNLLDPEPKIRIDRSRKIEGKTFLLTN